jgi:hypothetical protein
MTIRRKVILLQSVERMNLAMAELTGHEGPALVVNDNPSSKAYPLDRAPMRVTKFIAARRRGRSPDALVPAARPVEDLSIPQDDVRQHQERPITSIQPVWRRFGG